MISPEDNNMSLEEKCEILMNEVVEYRKQFGKICRDYQQKTSLAENKMLQLQIWNIENTCIKPKLTVSEIDVEKVINDRNKFQQELLEQEQRIEFLGKDVKNVKQALTQMKACPVSKKILSYQKLMLNVCEDTEKELKVGSEIRLKLEKKKLKDNKTDILDRGKNMVTGTKIERKELRRCKKENKIPNDFRNCIDLTMEE